MTIVEHQILTVQEFLELPPARATRELVRGEVIENMPPGGKHGGIALLLGMLLKQWIKQLGGGFVGVESGFILARDPDTVRGPVVSYVQASRIPPMGVPESFWQIAPDLAVEIVSPTETADEVRDKVRDYLTAGTPLVWMVYPRSREVVAHTADGLARTYTRPDTLAFPDVLPGFACRVSELFD